MTDIEQLKKEANEVEKGLEELKNNVSISESEKKTKAEELKTKAESTKHKIESEIASLSEKTDDESKRKKEEAETLLNTFNETVKLYASVLASSETKPQNEDSKEKAGDEEKGFFKKTGEWIGEQRTDVWDEEKWEQERGKNWLRIGGFALTGVGALALAYTGIKKLFGKKKKKESDSSDSSKETEAKKKGFWEKPLGKTITGIGMGLGILSGVYYVAHGAVTGNWAPRDMFDRSREKKLKFDDAMNYCKGAIANEKGIEGAQYDMDLKYDENTSEIEAYGERIKIDKNARKIEGLAVTFKTYEHMINTAIIIAFLKKNYSGMCSKKDPFSLSGSRTGNVEVNTNEKNEKALDGTGKGGRITCIGGAAILSIIAAIRSKSVKVGASMLTATGALGFIGGYALDTDNPMSKHMPELDNEYGKMALAGYLNSLGCWEAKKQSIDDISESPIKSEVETCMNDLEYTNRELVNRGSRRKLDAVQDPNNPSRYTIKAYSRDFSAEISGEGDNRKIKILGISGGNPSIKVNPNHSENAEKFFNLEMPLKEGLYLSNLLGYLLEDNNNCVRKGNKYPYFYYGKRFGLTKPGIYFNDPNWDTYILTQESFEKKLPTVFNNKNVLLDFLNDGMVFDNGCDIRRNPDTLKDA